MLMQDPVPSKIVLFHMYFLFSWDFVGTSQHEGVPFIKYRCFEAHVQVWCMNKTECLFEPVKEAERLYLDCCDPAFISFESQEI